MRISDWSSDVCSSDLIAYTLQDSAPAALLTQADTLDRVGALNVPIIDLDSLQLQAELGSNPQIPELTPSHLAYVLYTSGRSEERRVGKEWVITCRSRGAPYH